VTVSWFSLFTRARTGALAVLCAAALSACGAAPPPKPVPFSFNVQSGANLNPDASGRASPVVVRVYQLTTDGDFLKADFFALYRNDEATLGKTLVAKQEFIAVPGEKSSVRVDLANTAGVLGVVVAFRDINQADWRLTSPAKNRAPTLVLEANKAHWAAAQH
jgi:type VI secretion system protein VasD